MDFENKPYAQFIEESLQRLFTGEVECIGMQIIRPDGAVETGYFNADATDISVMMHNMELDVFEQYIKANGERIKKMLEGEDPDEE